MANFEYNIGDIIVGTVKEIRPYGAIISFNDEFEGLLHISEISDRYVSDINYFCEVNKNIAVKIIDINEFNNFMRLSLKKKSSSKPAFAWTQKEKNERKY